MTDDVSTHSWVKCDRYMFDITTCTVDIKAIARTYTLVYRTLAIAGENTTK